MPLILSASLCVVGILVTICLGAKPRRMIAVGAIGLTISFLFLVGLMFFSLLLVSASLACMLCGCVLLRFPAATMRTRVAALTACVLLPAILLTLTASVRIYRDLELRERYPYVSIRERVEPVNPAVYEVQDVMHIEESDPFRQGIVRFVHSRRAGIRALHRSAIYHFLEASEFGVSRMSAFPLQSLAHEDGSPIRIEADTRSSSELPEFLSPGETPQLSTDRMQEGHFAFGSWFLDASRFGDVKDLDQVAGFLPHAIVDASWDTSPPAIEDIHSPFNETLRGSRETGPTLKLEKLQMVGLLYHPEPVVYDIDTLPELLSAETAPTRELDAFELRSLAILQQGNAIHVESKGDAVRMMGALRNSESCTECHTGPTTQLLGAFSYVLRFEQTDATGVPLMVNLP